MFYTVVCVWTSGELQPVEKAEQPAISGEGIQQRDNKRAKGVAVNNQRICVKKR